jgi:hypothetical protein
MAKVLYNPFVIGHYVSDEYFCDRQKETEFLIKQMRNGRNVVLVSPRRIGKSDLIHHLFHQPEIAKNYYTFFIDIYATNSLAELVYSLGKAVFDALKPKHRRSMEKFFEIISSLRMGFSLDPMTGEPSFDLSIGDIKAPQTTLKQIFDYLQQSDKPCIVAFDEFQQITAYKEKNVEALLRTYIQNCSNARFIYSGSRRDMMTQMFQSASRPFYSSSIITALEPINGNTYSEFAIGLFKQRDRVLLPEVPEEVYKRYEGYTWFIQMLMNELFDMTPAHGRCMPDMIAQAENNVIMIQSVSYRETMARLSVKQRALLVAIAKERKAERVTSADFVSKYQLSSPSSVQAALKPMLSGGIVTEENNVYKVYDFFFAEWIRRSY